MGGLFSHGVRLPLLRQPSKMLSYLRACWVGSSLTGYVYRSCGNPPRCSVTFGLAGWALLSRGTFTAPAATLQDAQLPSGLLGGLFSHGVRIPLLRQPSKMLSYLRACWVGSSLTGYVYRSCGNPPRCSVTFGLAGWALLSRGTFTAPAATLQDAQLPSGLLGGLFSHGVRIPLLRQPSKMLSYLRACWVGSSLTGYVYRSCGNPPRCSVTFGLAGWALLSRGTFTAPAATLQDAQLPSGLLGGLFSHGVRIPLLRQPSKMLSYLRACWVGSSLTGYVYRSCGNPPRCSVTFGLAGWALLSRGTFTAPAATLQDAQLPSGLLGGLFSHGVRIPLLRQPSKMLSYLRACWVGSSLTGYVYRSCGNPPRCSVTFGLAGWALLSRGTFTAPAATLQDAQLPSGLLGGLFSHGVRIPLLRQPSKMLSYLRACWVGSSLTGYVYRSCGNPPRCSVTFGLAGWALLSRGTFTAPAATLQDAQLPSGLLGGLFSHGVRIPLLRQPSKMLSYLRACWVGSSLTGYVYRSCGNPPRCSVTFGLAGWALLSRGTFTAPAATLQDAQLPSGLLGGLFSHGVRIPLLRQPSKMLSYLRACWVGSSLTGYVYRSCGNPPRCSVTFGLAGWALLSRGTFTAPAATLQDAQLPSGLLGGLFSHGVRIPLLRQPSKMLSYLRACWVGSSLTGYVYRSCGNPPRCSVTFGLAGWALLSRGTFTAPAATLQDAQLPSGLLGGLFSHGVRITLLRQPSKMLSYLRACWVGSSLTGYVYRSCGNPPRCSVTFGLAGWALLSRGTFTAPAATLQDAQLPSGLLGGLFSHGVRITLLRQPSKMLSYFRACWVGSSLTGYVYRPCGNPPRCSVTFGLAGWALLSRGTYNAPAATLQDAQLPSGLLGGLFSHGVRIPLLRQPSKMLSYLRACWVGSSLTGYVYRSCGNPPRCSVTFGLAGWALLSRGT